MGDKQIDQQKNKIIESLKMQAQKLAVLLYNSSIPDDVKEAWIVMLPHMSLQQIARLLDILESKFINQETRDIDEKYRDKLQLLVDDFKKKGIARDKRLLNQINSLK